MATVALAFPPNSNVTSNVGSLEVKQWWLFNEWNGSNPVWRGMIQNDFPNSGDLHPSNPSPQISRIQVCFHKMRGAYEDVWGNKRETAV